MLQLSTREFTEALPASRETRETPQQKYKDLSNLPKNLMPFLGASKRIQ